MASRSNKLLETSKVIDVVTVNVGCTHSVKNPTPQILSCLALPTGSTRLSLATYVHTFTMSCMFRVLIGDAVSEQRKFCRDIGRLVFCFGF